MSLRKPRVRTMRSYMRAGIKSHTSGQGFQSTSFDNEYQIIRKGWDQRLDDSEEKYHRILTEMAKEQIRKAFKEGRFKDRMDATQPPFMHPSDNPDLYSQWCSFCDEFGRRLVLCAGCRVGLCMTGGGGLGGCVRWSAMAEDPDLVFYCPFCAKAAKKPCVFQLTRDPPHKLCVYFRCDSPVLIISTTWHGTVVPYAPILYDALRRSYQGHEDLVALMIVALDPGAAGADGIDKGGVGYDVEATDDSQAAEEFLKQHPTAKIIVTIDTHCNELGDLVWKDDTEGKQNVCTVGEILKDCIPEGVFTYLSDGDDTPEHFHKSIVVNLACGASVSQEAARNTLLKGHGANAVLSFAAGLTLVGNVLTSVTAFLMHWAKSPSDYDVIFAATMAPEWIKERRPVLSQRDFGHTLYAMFSYGEPGGQLVICHRHCGQTLDVKLIGKRVRFTCVGCNSRCFTPFIKTDETTILGRRRLIKITYPQEQYPTEWKLLPAPEQPPKTIVQPPKTIVQPPRAVVQPPGTVVQPPGTVVQPPSISSEAIIHPPSSGVDPQSLTTSSASSSSLRITIPPRLRGPTSAISRSQSPATPAISPSQSASGTVGHHDTAPTPPPPSPLEPSSTGPRKRRSSQSLNTIPRQQKMRKNRD